MAAEGRDVIVSAFASSGKTLKLADGSKIDLKEFAQPLDIFAEKPILIGVDATTEGAEIFYDKAFSRQLERYRDQNGSILTRFLASHLAGVKVRRVAVVGFSAGGVFVKGILKSPDAAFVDTAIFLDAIHLGRPYAKAPPLGEAVAPLANYGVRAASSSDPWLGPLMIQAHTHIASPAPDAVTSTRESAEAITAVVKANAPGAIRFGFNPDLFFEGPPPPGVTLGPGTGLPPPAKTFEEIPDPAGTGIGNYHVFDFGGTVGADHAFITWFVQRAIFKAFLAPRWNEGLDCKPGTGELGQSFCGPGGIIVPDGVFTVPAGPNWEAALAGLAVGIGLGFVATR